MVGMDLSYKDICKGGGDWVWNRVQTVIRLPKPAYYEHDKGGPSAL